MKLTAESTRKIVTLEANGASMQARIDSNIGALLFEVEYLLSRELGDPIWERPS